MDVARSIVQDVTVDRPTVNFGFFDWPHRGDDPVTRKVTYTNRGRAAVQLDLRGAMVDDKGTAAPSDAMVFSTRRVDIAAGASATVRVTVDPDALRVGRWGGLLTATDAAGRQIRSAFGLVKETEKYTLRVRVLDRSGAVAQEPLVTLFNPRTGEAPSSFDLADWTRPVFRVSPGPWHVAAAIGDRTSTTLAAKLDVSVKGDTRAVLDARNAVPVRFHLPRRDTETVLTALEAVSYSDAGGSGLGLLGFGGDFYATPTGPPRAGRFDFSASHTARAPELVIRVPSSGERISTMWHYTPGMEGRHDVEVVDRGNGRTMPGVRGRWVLVQAPVGKAVDDTIRRAARAGAKGVLFWTDGPEDRYWIEEMPAVAVVALTRSSGAKVADLAADGPGDLRMVLRPFTPWTYQVLESSKQRIPADLDFRYTASSLATVDRTFHSHGVEGLGAPVRFPADVSAWVAVLPVRLGSTRTDYVSPGRWQSYFEVVGPQDEEGWPTTAAAWEATPQRYAAGGRYSEQWLDQVVRPAQPRNVPYNILPTREGNFVTGYLSPWTDGSGRVGYYTESDRFTVRLTSGGKTILASTQPFLEDVRLPGSTAGYELSLKAERRVPGVWERSTRTSTRWTFASGKAASPASLRLLSLHAVMPLSRDNATPSETLRFPVSAYLPADLGAAKVQRLSAATSYDGGRTWHRAAVTRTGSAGFEVVVRHGDYRGPVALRMAATDDGGASVTQTIHAAYVVR